MTPEQYANHDHSEGSEEHFWMEEMRKRIAVFHGWELKEEPVGSKNPHAWWHLKTRYPSYVPTPYPNYFNDLNGVKDAVNFLADGDDNFKPAMFALWLAWIRDGSEKGKEPDESWADEYIHEPWRHVFNLVTSPAWSLAEALLRTIGKWDGFMKNPASTC